MKLGGLLSCVLLAACRPADSGAERNGFARPARFEAPATPPSRVAAGPSESDHSIVPPGHPSLCRTGEKFLFACDLGRSKVAVCGGTSPSGRDYAQYRFGRPGRLELVHPAGLEEGAGSMTWAFTGYSGGGESQIRFVNEGVEYVVYSSVTRAGFDEENFSAHDFRGGLLVRRGNRTLSKMSCQASADAQPDINNGADAQVDLMMTKRFMPEGAFVMPEK